MAGYFSKTKRIVDEAVSGRLDVSEIQRGFVWSPVKLKDFTDSLWRDYPVGTFLCWQGASEPRSVVGIEHERKWIVDGQQRTVALCFLFGKKPYWFNNEDWNDLYHKYDVLVDITSARESLEFALPNPIRKRASEWISVRDILTCDNLTKVAVETLKKLGKEGDLDLFAEIHEKLQSVQKIADRDIYLGVVYHEPVDVAEIFSRLNMKGTKVKESDVVIALTAARKPGWVREEFLPFLRDLEVRGYDFDPAVLIRTLVALRRGVSRLSGLPEDFWEADGFEKAWQQTRETVTFNVRSFCEFGVLSSDLLPSHNALIPLFVLFERFKDSYDFKKALFWFLRATWDGRYSGSAITTLDQDLKGIRESDNFDTALNELHGRLRVDMKVSEEDFLKVDEQGVHSLMVYLVIFQAKAIDWISKTRIGYDKTENALNEGFSPQWHHFFPKRLLRKTGVAEDQVNSLANLTVLTERQRAFQSEPAEYIQRYKIPLECLEQQFIPLSSELWKLGRYGDFLKERSRLLDRAVNQFLAGLKGGA